MHQPQHESQLQKDEIDLLDLVSILWKRKTLILGGTFLATVAAAIISLLLPKVYEVSTIIEPGKIEMLKAGDEVYIIPPETLKESILGGAYDFKIKADLNLPVDVSPKFKVVIPKGTSLVKISVETSDTRLSTDILNMLNKIIEREINSRMDVEKREIDNQIKAALLKNQKIVEMVVLTKNHIDATASKIKALESSKAKALSTSSEGAMNVLLYSNEIQDQQVYLNNLQEKLKSYEEEAKGSDLRIDNLNIQMSRLKGMNVVKQVSVSDKTVKPNRRLIVATSFFCSFLFLSIIALVFHYVEVRANAFHN